jgi:ribonuclease VapC
MVLDSSALIAILIEEPEWRDLIGKIDAAETGVVGAPTVFETAVVLARKARETSGLTAFLKSAEIEVVPFDERHFQAALDAFTRFGKGRHAAGLNFGDCMTYAVASLSGLPLLYVGDDFSRTDIEAA